MQPVFDRAIALIQDYDGEQLAWMFRRHEAARATQSLKSKLASRVFTSRKSLTSKTTLLELPWADRLEKESYRESLAREVDWQYQLSRKQDYIICSTPRISLIVDPIRLEVISRDDAIQHGFGILEVYAIQLYGKKARRQLDEHASADFVRLSEMNQGRTFTPQTKLLIHWLESPGLDQ